MIAVFSSSSPIAGVALFREGGALLAAASEDAPMAASGACLRLLRRLLEEAAVSLSDVSLFVADVGPGSFTGTRVGVVLAKTLAFAQSAKAAGIPSFDLISPNELVAVPSRKGEYFIRAPGKAPVRSSEVPEGAVGYGPAFTEPLFPNPSACGSLLNGLAVLEPERLVPEYLMEPSISQPKSPYRASGVPGG